MESTKIKDYALLNYLRSNNLKNDVYINRKRNNLNLKEFYAKRVKLLFNDEKFENVNIYGLGACVHEALLTSVYIVKSYSNIEIKEITSDTVDIEDKKINLIKIVLINK
jgi:hypothetical protein